MVLLRTIILVVCLGLSLAVPFLDRDEQQFIDNLLLNSQDHENKRDSVHPSDENDELELERISLHNQQKLHSIIPSKNREQFQLIKKAAAAIVKRLSMPSPPNIDSLINKAVYFVFKESHPAEDARIRSALKEQVEKMIFENKSSEEQVSKESGLREEKILIAVEDVLSELAVQLNLTTLQVKFLVNTSVNVLAQHFGLKPWQNHELHERVTSHVRSQLKYEDWDNKDARLRRLEEKIEKEIISLKLTNKQAKRLVALMVAEEAVKESLSLEEKLRMLKRVIVDIKDDFKTEKLEQESGPPKLSSVDVVAINNLIRQKSLEAQLTKKELKVLGLAILTAIENLTMHVSATPTPTPAKQETLLATEVYTKKETVETLTEKPTDGDDLDLELEGTKPPFQETETKSFELRKTFKIPTTTKVTSSIYESTTETITDSRGETEDDLIAKLAQDEKELEERDFQPKPKGESQDDLEMEIEERFYENTPTDVYHKSKTLETKAVDKRSTEKYEPTKPIKATEKQQTTRKVEHLIPTTENEEELLEEHRPTEGHKLKTQSTTNHELKTTGKTITTKESKATTTVISSTLGNALEENRLEGFVPQPTSEGYTTKATQPKTVKQIYTTPKITPEERNPTIKITNSVSSIEAIDVMEDGKTRPTVGHTSKATQHSTQRHSITQTEDNGLEEENFTGHLTEPNHNTPKFPAKSIGSTKKNIHSRRHRVKIMDDDAEFEDLGLKRREDDSSLEEDLNLIGTPEKRISLEEELQEALSQKEAETDNLLDNELKDLNDG